MHECILHQRFFGGLRLTCGSYGTYAVMLFVMLFYLNQHRGQFWIKKLQQWQKMHNKSGVFRGMGDYKHIQKFKHSKNIGQQWRWDKKLSLSKVTSLKAIYAWSYLFTYFFLKKLHYCGHFFYTMNVCGT